LEKRVPILLLGVSFSLRIALTWFHITHGSQAFGTLYPFADFEGYVQPQLGFLAQGLLPYRDFAYSLTPLFLYALYPFYSIGGMTAATIPIIGADAVVPVVIYLTAKEVGGRRVGIIAGLVYAFSPLALFYEGLIWMNSEPALLFALLSLYFMQQKRASTSALALGIAVLFNQSTLALVPVAILWQLRETRRQFARSSFLFLATLLIGSLPFLLLMPLPYLQEVSFGILGALKPGPGFHYVGGNFDIAAITNSTLASSAARLESLQASGTCTGLINLLTDVETCAANGTIFYSVNHPQGFLGALGLFSDKVGFLLMVGMTMLAIPALWVIRRAANFYLTTSVFSSIAFLVVYSAEAHPVIRYYLLLPYALLLVSSVKWRHLTVPIVAMVVSIFTPDGNFQLMLLLGSLLLFITLQEGAATKRLHPKRLQRGT